MDRHTFLINARAKLMLNRRVICTGNPDRVGTLAHGFRKIFPEAVFLCTSTGYDLNDHSQSMIDRLQKAFTGCNTFLNCSYIAPGVQPWLLQVCHDSLKFCDVVNIGSTHEYDGLGHQSYQRSKLDLRALSLRLDTFRFRTYHVILGGIKNDNTEVKKNWLDIDLICHEIVSLWTKPYHQPIVSMDQNKAPW